MGRRFAKTTSPHKEDQLWSEYTALCPPDSDGKKLKYRTSMKKPLDDDAQMWELLCKKSESGTSGLDCTCKSIGRESNHSVRLELGDTACAFYSVAMKTFGCGLPCP